MNPSSTNNFPWELIGSSFTGNLTQDDESHLQQWLDANSDNKAKYQQLQDLWNNSTEDYKLYLMGHRVISFIQSVQKRKLIISGDCLQSNSR